MYRWFGATLGVWWFIAGAQAAPASAACDHDASPATFTAEVAAASRGETICLTTGDYGSWTGTDRAITIAAGAGQSPAMKVNLGAGDGGFTLDGLTAMGGVIADGVTNVVIRNSAFTSSITIGGTGTHGIVLDGNRHDWMVGPSTGGDNAKIYLQNTLSGTLTAPSVTIKNSEIANGDLDGIHFGGGSGYLVLGNRFENLCQSSGNHTDNMQFDTSPTSQVRIAGNYVQASCATQGITSYDAGTDGVIIEDNVVDVPRDWGIELYADKNSVVRHNTVVWHDKAYSMFNTGAGRIDIDRKSANPAGTGTQVYDNIATGVSFTAGSTGAAHHNVSGQRAVYVGPPTAFEGFKLAANSPVGRETASDGLDNGVRVTADSGVAPPPRTAPVNSVWTAPASARVGTPVILDGSRSTGAGLTCRWSFENADGTGIFETIAGCAVSKTFLEAGTKYVKLTVTDANGNSDASKQSFRVAVDDLVASFGFNESSGRAVRDASGLAHTGTIHGARRISSGRHGRALRFDGNDSVVVADSASLDLAKGMTLEAWVRPVVTDRSLRTVVAKRRVSGVSYGLFAGAIAAKLWTSHPYTASRAALPLRRWSHLAATYDGGRLRVYVNGRLAGSTRVRGPIRAGHGRLVIGDRFKGTIDDVRVWRTPLSAAALRVERRADP